MNICIFGDSVVWGAHDSENGGWTTLLRNHFENLYPKININVYSLGINGATSSTILESLEAESKPRKPDLIIIATGINDCAQIPPFYQNWVDFNTFKNNLLSLTILSTKLSAQHIFVGITPLEENKTTPLDDDGEMYRSAERYRYDQGIKQHCQQNNITYISLDSIVTTADLSDGLHPNTAGHLKIFAAVKPVVEKMLLSP